MAAEEGGTALDAVGAGLVHGFAGCHIGVYFFLGQFPEVQVRHLGEGFDLISPDHGHAADTIVVCAGRVLGKPHSPLEAVQTLKLLSGRDHQVMTGMCVLRGSREVVCTEVTDIHFRPLTDREIDRYIATKEPMDKAGSYGIQGGAALFAEKMAGDYYNVMGLPVCRLGQILKELAPDLMEEFL